MAEAQTRPARADADIAADVQRIIMTYPPLNHDRHHIHVAVEDGHVVIRGHTRTPISHRYFVEMLPGVAGVVRLDIGQFYSDEAIRLEAGRYTPLEVSVADVYYGNVVLAGMMPDGESEREIVERVQQIPGVVKVITSFTG